MSATPQAAAIAGATAPPATEQSSERYRRISRLGLGATAFIGRALKGPLNQAVVINSFNDFQTQFGGHWQPATLGYAVQQYFDSGGSQAIIVRVCNGGSAATLSLPTADGALVLRGQTPGTRVYLRAAVDYDGLAAGDGFCFNLVVQRLRQPGSELVEDQEIFQRVSLADGAERPLQTLLARSRLVRIEGRLPAGRPLSTHTARATGGYLPGNADADDGAELSDYDLIGEAEHRTGLFALNEAPHFGQLCIPPLGRERDVGLPAWLVASRLCRQWHATLIVDTPRAWDSAEAAAAGARQWPLRSADAVMYFPRLQAFDRLRGRAEVFANCGAVAGLLVRAESSTPVWAAGACVSPVLRPGIKPALTIEPSQAEQLGRLGVNLLPATRQPDGATETACTLMPENAARAGDRWLGARRLFQFLMASIEAGTGWAATEPNCETLWQRLAECVSEFLSGLDRDSAFIGDDGNPGYFVLCDERLNRQLPGRALGARLLFGVAAVHGGSFAAFLLTQSPTESSVRPVNPNWLAVDAGHADSH